MKIIKNENNKAMFNAAVFLVLVGVLLFLRGYYLNNDATLFLGGAFALLSVFCTLLIVLEKILWAKVLWGFLTPVLIFFAPAVFSLTNSDAIFTYSYYYMGGVMYTTYSFQDEKEKKFMWISILLFFIGVVFYDRFLIAKNFQGTDLALLLSQNYSHFKSAQIIHFISLVYLVIVVHKNKHTIEKRLSDKIVMLQNFTTDLIQISKNKVVYSGDLTESLEEILKSAAKVMSVSRISVWEVDEQSQVLSMKVCYDVLKDEFSYSATLVLSHYPTYFKYLLEEKIIVAHDVIQDAKTYEFKDSYAIPLGIKSMMDTPFFIDGNFKGILCCEEQRTYRHWDEMDELFSASIGKLITIAYYCRVKREQFAVMEALNNQMVQINGELTTDLKLKDKGLKEMQEFIGEMSFKNAHHVRGPLSRMLGLLHLYQLDEDIENRSKYIHYLEESAKELDGIIKEVSRILSTKKV